MKKYIKFFIFLFTFVFVIGGLASCDSLMKDPDAGTTEPDNTNKPTETPDQKEAIYKLALESGYTGTYEEWLESIKGDYIELSVTSTHIVWKYANESIWRNLIELSKLSGPQGAAGSNGADGKDGVDGKTPEFRVNAGYLEWKYTTDTEWIKLYEINTEVSKPEEENTPTNGLTPYIGENGNWWIGNEDTKIQAEGKDGKTPEFRVNDGYMEWKYSDESSWKQLFKITSGSTDTNWITVTLVTDYEFDDNDQIIPIESSEFVIPVGAIEEPDITKDGYKIIGWAYYDEYEEEYLEWKFKHYYSSVDITLYAVWEEAYTLTFVDEDGNIVKTEEVCYDELIECPTIDVEDGYAIKYYIENTNETVDKVFYYDYRGDITIVCKKCKEAPSGTRNIVFYSTMNSSFRELVDKKIQEFEEKYPGWTVEHYQIGGYDDVKQSIINGLTSNDYPDLAYCYPEHVAQYMTTGKVVDMNKYINGLTDTVYIQSEGDWIQEFVTAGFTAEELADFVPGYYAQGLATNYADYNSYGYNENSVLTLPFVKSTEVLFYNEDALNELGVSVPETWDELWEICHLAKEKWPNSVPLGYDSEANWFITMCKQNGWDYTSTQEPYYLFNNVDTQAWLNDLKGYYEQGLFTTLQIYGGYSSNLFINGSEYGSIFSIGSSAGARYQDPYGKFNWGVAPIPGSPQEDGTINNSVISQGPSLVMFSPTDTNASEKELMTWLFVEELMEPEFQAEFAMLSGYNSCKKSTVDIDEYKAFLESDSIVAVTACVAAEMSDRYFYSPVFVGSNTARDEVGMAFIYAITGSKTPQQALEDALKKCWYN